MIAIARHEPGGRRGSRIRYRRRPESGGGDRGGLDACRAGWRVTATVFVASWALSLGAVATLALLLADGANARQDGAPADWVIAVQASLAVLLLLVAARQWRGRGDGGTETELPAWMQKVDGLTIPRAAAMAVFLAAENPRTCFSPSARRLRLPNSASARVRRRVRLRSLCSSGRLHPASRSHSPC